MTELIPPSLAFELNIFAVCVIGETLILATPAPFSEELQERLEFVLNRKVRGVVRSLDWIREQLEKLYAETPRSDSLSSPVTWYWPEDFSLDGQNLRIPCSGWNLSEHWSGVLEVLPDQSNYALWCWIVSVPQYHRLIEEQELPAIRRIWNRMQTRSEAPRD